MTTRTTRTRTIARPRRHRARRVARMTTDDPPRSTKRPVHAATGGRILAAGVSASVAVGLVAVMARPRAEDVVLTVTPPQAAAAPPETAPTTTAPPRVVVVIVEDGPAATTAPAPARRAPATTPATASPAPPPTVAVPAPPTTLAPKPAVTPTTAKPNTKTRAS